MGKKCYLILFLFGFRLFVVVAIFVCCWFIYINSIQVYHSIPSSQLFSYKIFATNKIPIVIIIYLFIYLFSSWHSHVFCQVTIILDHSPGQGIVLHLSKSRLGPWHWLPPWAGAGLSQRRVLSLVPWPHVTLQAVHWPQSL